MCANLPVRWPAVARASSDCFGLRLWDAAQLVSCKLEPDSVEHIFCTEVANKAILRAIVSCGINVVFASPSCQPWSVTGTGKGLHAALGLNMADLVDAVSLIQPLCVCIENVTGLPKHPHWDWICSTLFAVGFRLIHSCCHDTAGWLPTSRRRLVAIFIRRDLQHPPDLVQDLQKIKLPDAMVPSSVSNSSCLIDSPSLDSEPLRLNDLEMWNLSDPKLLPSEWKSGNYPQDAIKARFVKPFSQAGPIMASYRVAPSFPVHVLQPKGLLTILKEIHGAPAFLHPFEVLRLPCDFATTYRMLAVVLRL